MRVGIAAVMAASVFAVGCVTESQPIAGDQNGPITTGEAEPGDPSELTRETENRGLIKERWSYDG